MTTLLFDPIYMTQSRQLILQNTTSYFSNYQFSQAGIITQETACKNKIRIRNTQSCSVSQIAIYRVGIKNYRKKALDLKFEQDFKANNQKIIEYFISKVDYTNCINADKKAYLYNKKTIQKDEDIKFANQKMLNLMKIRKLSVYLGMFDQILRFEKPITTRNRLFQEQTEFLMLLYLAQRIKIFQGKYVGVRGDEEELQQIIGTRIQDVNKARQLSSAKLSYSVLKEFIKSNEKHFIIGPQIDEQGNVCLKNVQQFLEWGLGSRMNPDLSRLKQIEIDRYVRIKVLFQ
ncbi:unnamed protein product (macronuclear) [Paramecium tetraurelia]|uniref:Uncharacterized protein n=1 Tax=Paramecium tetraurelia TaxID=5888 RepID=A0CNQ9_PARTE|nr:uncharacterized protein GSPATT00008868001 [Paramecium tetraurelia]CAK72426.1 unnamed protein product [Paramecium tetraurelia]|eukprot:XP_001439823.1 hypothetical protein (macronuclear) [Paramecium tetraurelia strain d4-2]